MKGKFITFEGSEGSGKSTQSKLLYNYLKNRGFKIIYLREPGGTLISEKIRRILLDCKHNSMSDVCEMLLYMAARAQLVKEVINPALQEGKIVICDRFLDSTLAYQGFGLGMDLKLIRYVGKLATYGLKPDLTVFMDLPVEKGLAKCGSAKDRIERRSCLYHLRVRNGYLKLQGLEPRRIRIVKVEKDKFVTQDKIRSLILSFLKRRK